jgi:hypothetical protein
MNAVSSSYDWMRQRRKRRAGCPPSLQTRVLERKSIAAQTSPCLAMDFVIIGRHWKLRQTVMSGRITAAVVDFAVLLQEIGCAYFASSGLFLVRN